MGWIDGRRALRALGLFGLLLAVYFYTYTGQSFSSDEVMLYDAVHSFVHNGTFELAYANDLQNYVTLPDDQVAVRLNVEPLQVYAAAPLLWLAEHLPGVGAMQTVWLFNGLVAALAAIILFYYGVVLGYAEHTALAVALIFGLATIIWPYSQMFFREPLFMLMALLCAYTLEKWRQGLARQPGWLILAVLAYVGLSNAKDAAPLFFPAFLIIGIPDGFFRAVRRLNRRVFLLLIPAILALIGAGLLLSNRYPEIAARLSDQAFAKDFLSYTPGALLAYLISPGFSVWAFSPVLLLGLIGAFRLLRTRKIRQFLMPLSVLLLFAVGHATIHGAYWYGGLGWGPRFLVPITPFLALWLLPAVDGILAGRWRFWAWGLAVGLLALSFGLQALTVKLPVDTFPNFLRDEGQRLGREIVPWQDGVWNLQYIPQVVIARQTGKVSSGLAWSVNGTETTSLLLCLLAAGVGLLALARTPRTMRGRWLIGGAMPLSLAIMFGGGMHAYYHDPRYGGDDASLWKMLSAIQQDTRPGDAVILGNLTYRLFFMNYFKLATPVYVLPNAPGELLNPNEPPFVVSDNMEERAEPYLQMMLSRIALHTSRWWFVTEYSEFATNRYRVNESYLARHYFPVEERVTEPRVRLIIYAPVGAPPDTVPPWPTNPVNADFGAATLVGIDLPRGTTFKPGDLLPASLLWRHDGWPADLEPFDYSVNLSLIDKDGVTQAQRAVGPQGTFGKMSLWVPGGYYRDNHALALRPDLPPGDYELWALVFDWRNGGKPLPLRNRPGQHVIIAKIHVDSYTGGSS
jgi:hypothetical protein